MINLICSSLLSVCFSLLSVIFSAGVKYLQEPYIWLDGDCISTFWWRHIRGITGITILEVTFWLQYCLCFWHLSILSIWIRPPFVRKRKEQRTKQKKRRIVWFLFIVFWCCVILLFSALGFCFIASSHWERPLCRLLGFSMYSILFDLHLV